MGLYQAIVVRIIEHAIDYKITVDKLCDALVAEYFFHNGTDISIVDCLVHVDQKRFLLHKGFHKVRGQAAK